MRSKKIRTGMRRAGVVLGGLVGIGLFVALLLSSNLRKLSEVTSILFLAALAAVGVWALFELLGSGLAGLAKRRHRGPRH
ncbi:MAG: hypothetical protein QNJ94_01170 [Alphaproteobacteria bacterium]|nr:hypothetical protein [Alphaproteobacteria bacterium]